MKCTKCGREISEGKTLCNDCALSALTRAAESVQATKEPVYVAPKVYKPGSSLKLSIVALILSCVALYGTLIMVLPSLYNVFLTVFGTLPPAVLSIIFGAVVCKKTKIRNEAGTSKDNPSFIFGLVSFIQGLATIGEIFIAYFLLAALS